MAAAVDPKEASRCRSTSLQGRVAIVTGGTGGIGSAVVAHLATLGAQVVIGYVGDRSLVDHLLSTINTSSTPQAIAVEADVSDPAQVKALFDRAEQAFGKVHILVTTAAVIDDSYPTLANTSDEKWDWVFNINAKGTFMCCREAANRVVKGGGGRIITFSSSTVGSLRLGYGAYAATKGAIETMTKIMSRELKGTLITANAIAPGPIATPMFYAGKTESDVETIVEENPLCRIGGPEEIASFVGFLASDAGEWINAQVIRCNGGYV